MKLEDFAYAVAEKVFADLTHKHHFEVPADVRKEVLETVKREYTELVR